MISNCSRKFTGASMLMLGVIALALRVPRAEAATQSLCVNPGATSGCVATISDAVAAITAGNVRITVAPGTYMDNVSINTGLIGKKLTLTITGTAGAGSTIIDGNSANSVFTIGTYERIGATTITIDGLTIQNGLAMVGPNTLGGGIAAFGAVLTLKNSVVTNNRATSGAGVYDVNANVRIVNSSIVNNQGQGMASTGGGLYVESDVNDTRARKLSIFRTTTIPTRHRLAAGPLLGAAELAPKRQFSRTARSATTVHFLVRVCSYF